MRILTVRHDAKALHQPSMAIKAVDKTLVAFLSKLAATLRRQQDPEGVGLSAMQVGNPIRVFAMLPMGAKNEKSSVTFYINPEIVSHTKTMTLGETLTKSGEPFLEGCLSVPRIYAPVLRWEEIEVNAAVIKEADISENNQGLSLVTRRLSLSRVPARVFQHELDHLNGILFLDHALKQGGQLYEEIDGKLEPMEL